MRLTKYKLELVKESSCNYGGPDFALTNPLNVCRALNDVCRLNKQTEEVLYLVCLNVKNKIIGLHEVSRGTIDSSLASPREIFKRALLNNAAKIIIAHNHPSGEVNPSEHDKNFTKRLEDAGMLLNIPVIDSIIVGDDTYFSFKENLLM